MKGAKFRDSAVWVYEALSAQLSRETYRQWLLRAGYGNGALDGEGALFWLEGGFGVTPREQINMLCALYREALPFDAAHQRAVKAMMVLPAPAHLHATAGKTGLVTQQGRDIGWWCGWMEVADPDDLDGSVRVFFFATRLSRPAAAFDSEFAALRRQVTDQVAAAVFALEKQKE